VFRKCKHNSYSKNHANIQWLHSNIFESNFTGTRKKREGGVG
jgi:hypothetical protein